MKSSFFFFLISLLLVTFSYCYNRDETLLFPDLEVFSFPLPKPSCLYRKKIRENLRSFYDVDKLIRVQLEKTGYFQYSYYEVPHGFAIITRTERLNEDKSPVLGLNRWAIDVQKKSIKNLKDYQNNLLTPTIEGNYRYFVFYVSNVPISFSSLPTSRKASPDHLLYYGMNRLNKKISDRYLTSDSHLTVLIYEFAKEENQPIEFIEQSDFPAVQHLIKSGFDSFY